jgi:hypothetical protein
MAVDKVSTPKHAKTTISRRGIKWSRSIFSIKLKEYAQAEGVSAKLRVALESAAGLFFKNGVPEMVAHYKKVPCNSVRPHVDFLPGRSVTGTRLTHADTCIEEHASGVSVSTHFCGSFHHILDYLD